MSNVAPIPDGGVNEQALLLEMATTLVSQLQASDIDEANKTIFELCKLRETSLFQEIGKLTRDLHDGLNSFSHDKNFETLTKESLPDAKKRLDYVVQLTEESAHKTITVVEDSLATINDLGKRSLALKKYSDDLDSETFSEKLNEYLTTTISDAKEMNASLIEVLMAQSYQDVSGQVIQRVIKLVHDIETSLVDMIRSCGLGTEDGTTSVDTDLEKSSQAKLNQARSNQAGSNKQNDGHGFGPAVPGVKHDSGAKVGHEVVQSQDEVDDLLSTLGF